MSTHDLYSHRIPALMSTIVFSRYYSVTSALEVIFNEMRYINLRFTYLLTYLQELLNSTQRHLRVSLLVTFAQTMSLFATFDVPCRSVRHFPRPAFSGLLLLFCDPSFSGPANSAPTEKQLFSSITLTELKSLKRIHKDVSWLRPYIEFGPNLLARGHRDKYVRR